MPKITHHRIATLLAMIGLASLWVCCAVCSLPTAAAGDAEATVAHACCRQTDDAQPVNDPAPSKDKMPCAPTVKGTTLACTLRHDDTIASTSGGTPADWLNASAPAPFWVSMPLDALTPLGVPGRHTTDIPPSLRAASTLVSLHTMLTT